MTDSAKDHSPSPQRQQFPRVIEEQLPTAGVESVSGIIRNIGHGAVTSRAEAIRHSTDEAMVWQARPSPILMVKPIVKSLLFVVIVAFGCSVLQEKLDELSASRSADARSASEASAKPHRSGHAARSPATALSAKAEQLTSEQVERFTSALGKTPWVAALLAALVLLVRLAQLRAIKYAASSQRLILESGLLRTVNLPFELHHLGNAIIVRPLLLRPLGIAHVFIPGNRIELLGLRNADYVRDILRNAGQAEAQRIDKIRWR